MAAQTATSRKRRSSALEDSIAGAISLRELSQCDGGLKFDKIIRTLLNGVPIC